MADKTIGDLNFAPGTVDDSNTLFVVQQTGTAYKLSGHEFILALTTILDGHGGVKSVTYTAPTPPSLDGTMVVTLADNSATTVTIKNGRGITSVAKTGTSGLNDTYTISYNDGTTSTFVVKNGAKGDKGDAWYVWIRYAGQQPTSDADIGTTPDDWMGIYSGTSSTAPTHYTDYDWFEIKGEKGDTGAAAAVEESAVEYQVSNSGTAVPTGVWSSTVPTVQQGSFLWTRTTVTFNSGSPIVWYAVAYQAVDGQGSPGSATPLADSGSGVVGEANAYSRQDHRHPLNVDDVSMPQMDGTANPGTSSEYAHANHVHPHDNLIVRQNLLDNWYFVGGGSQLGFGVFPVNQRLQTNYSTTNAFCFDRWKLTSGTVTLDSNGIVLNGTIVQTLPKSIGLSTVASALLSDGTMITPIYNDSTRTFTLTASNKTIVAVKLEIGDTQTLAHEENGAWVLNEIPNYSAELDKCHHYLYPVCANSTSNGALVGGYAFSATSIRISVPACELSKNDPTIVFRNGSVSSLSLVSDSNALTPTAVSASSFRRSSSALLFFTVSGAAINKTYWLNSKDADFLLSAEL